MTWRIDIFTQQDLRKIRNFKIKIMPIYGSAKHIISFRVHEAKIMRLKLIDQVIIVLQLNTIYSYEQLPEQKNTP